MNLSERYKQLAPDREPYLRRGRVCASLTVPSVCPPEGHSLHDALPESYQSFGARASIHLASKLMQSMLPVGASSFRLDVSPKLLIQEGKLSVPPEVAKKLTLCETLVTTKMETLRWRRPTFVSLLHLVIVGNVLEHMLPDGRIKLFRLDQYVAVRDWEGKVVEVVTCEEMSKRSVPREYARALDPNKDDGAKVRLYTRFQRVGPNSYKVQQDLDGVTVSAEHEVSGPMPVNAMAWDLVPGEHYGRSHVEHHYADLRALEEDSKHLVEGGALAARHLTFVRPNAAGGNLRKRVAEARNGAVLAANPEDVVGFQYNNVGALQVLGSNVERVSRGLAAAFLLTSDLRRDAERVTAFELRMLAQELESALGGNYTLLSSEMQEWRIRLLMRIMEQAGELPALGDAVDLTITTGIEALGRDEKVNRVRAAFELVAAAGPFVEQAADYVKFDEILTPGMSALGFASAIRTDKEVQEERARREEVAMAQQIATAAAGPVAQAAMAPEAQ